jgi:hypothetical protein
MRRTKLLIPAALVAALAIQAQPGPQPQQSQPTAKPETGCDATPAPPKAPGKGFHFKLPKKVQEALDKQRARIERDTGISVPDISPEEIARQAAAKPCPPATPAAPAQPAPKDAQTAKQ